LGTQIRQNIQDRYGMPWSEPLARMREYVAAVQALFAAFRTGDAPHLEGAHYRITRLQPYFNPGPDESIAPPPVYLGGVNAGMCRLAGDVADGFVTHPTNSNPRYLQSLCRPAIAEGLARAGRSWDDLELVCGVRVVTGATPAELSAERERQRGLLAFLYSTPPYQRTLELYGWQALAGELQQLIRADRWDDLPAVITDEVMDALVPAAPFDELAPLLLHRFAGLADAVVLSPPDDPAHDDELAKVIAELQAG
jgi:probable F420-dependent oxidoreductase